MTKAGKIRAHIAAHDGNLRFEQVDAYIRNLDEQLTQEGL